jgi:outer membrane protein assembly factor BamB
MWRCNANRSGSSDETLPDECHLMWTFELPRISPAFRNKRLQFDAGYEPVVVGKTLLVGSPRDDSLTALHTETGKRMWRFRTDGPVRFAPVAWQDRVYVGSDDGYIYCLRTRTGELLWKYRPVPSHRKVIGNGRVISAWPVRGGPVLADGVLYAAAGTWPFEGIFVFALDAQTGRETWVNDRSGSLYLGHPHGGWSFGGPTLQGYLLIHDDELVVPNGTGGAPAFFDLKTGRLNAFTHLSNRVPGSWFVAANEGGKLIIDTDLSKEQHEDRVYETQWSNQGAWVRPGTDRTWTRRKWSRQDDARTSIRVGGRRYRFADGFADVTGEIHNMIAADGKMFVVTDSGSIRCYGTGSATPTAAPAKSKPPRAPDDWGVSARRMLDTRGATNGYALVWGIGSGRLVEELVSRSGMHIVAVDPSAERVGALRRRLEGSSLYGERVAVHVGNPTDCGLPPYMATLLTSEDLSSSGFSAGVAFAEAAFHSLRPYGGTACLSLSTGDEARLSAWVAQAGLERAEIRKAGGLTLLRRVGALPGAGNYTGGGRSHDVLVRAPLGILWYDDSVNSFKRSPQPRIVNGVMVSRPSAWENKTPQDQPYGLKAPLYTDVYTGRVMSPTEAAAALGNRPAEKAGEKTAQWRAPERKPHDAWGQRINPLTGQREGRVVPKSYGCDPGTDYGRLITMRSATAAYYDKQIESGLVNITGVRSGCVNSIIPANGVLNVPYFYEGCTCGYPLLCGMALVHMQEPFEQWMAWGTNAVASRITRVGINFGAPGDRMSGTGTLWLDVPSVGGPSPRVAVSVQPGTCVPYYRHALRMAADTSMPWVSASGIRGVEKVIVQLLPPGVQDRPRPYTVRLYFAEPDDVAPGSRVFDVALQGAPVLEGFDIVKEAGKPRRTIIKEFREVAVSDDLVTTFAARRGEAVVSGIELICTDDEAGTQ